MVDYLLFFRPKSPQIKEIWALNRSNLFFCLDETAIDPGSINCKLPRLKLSQVMAANHMRGVLSYK